MTTTASSAIQLTDAVAYKVYQLITEEENPELKLRAFITGGGCSGFQYGFTFDEEKQDDDTVVEKTITVNNAANEGDDGEGGDGQGGREVTVTLLVDSLSIQYLQGADIDYKDDVEGARFVISNPNAKTTCGCGSSFSA